MTKSKKTPTELCELFLHELNKPDSSMKNSPFPVKSGYFLSKSEPRAAQWCAFCLRFILDDPLSEHMRWKSECHGAEQDIHLKAAARSLASGMEDAIPYQLSENPIDLVSLSTVAKKMTSWDFVDHIFKELGLRLIPLHGEFTRPTDTRTENVHSETQTDLLTTVDNATNTEDISLQANIDKLIVDQDNRMEHSMDYKVDQDCDIIPAIPFDDFMNIPFDDDFNATYQDQAFSQEPTHSGYMDTPADELLNQCFHESPSQVSSTADNDNTTTSTEMEQNVEQPESVSQIPRCQLLVSVADIHYTGGNIVHGSFLMSADCSKLFAFSKDQDNAIFSFKRTDKCNTAVMNTLELYKCLVVEHHPLLVDYQAYRKKHFKTDEQECDSYLTHVCKLMVVVMRTRNRLGQTVSVDDFLFSDQVITKFFLILSQKGVSPYIQDWFVKGIMDFGSFLKEQLSDAHQEGRRLVALNRIQTVIRPIQRNLELVKEKLESHKEPKPTVPYSVLTSMFHHPKVTSMIVELKDRFSKRPLNADESGFLTSLLINMFVHENSGRNEISYKLMMADIFPLEDRVTEVNIGDNENEKDTFWIITYDFPKQSRSGKDKYGYCRGYVVMDRSMKDVFDFYLEVLTRQYPVPQSKYGKTTFFRKPDGQNVANTPYFLNRFYDLINQDSQDISCTRTRVYLASLEFHEYCRKLFRGAFGDEMALLVGHSRETRLNRYVEHRERCLAVARAFWKLKELAVVDSAKHAEAIRNLDDSMQVSVYLLKPDLNDRKSSKRGANSVMQQDDSRKVKLTSVEEIGNNEDDWEQTQEDEATETLTTRIRIQALHDTECELIFVSNWLPRTRDPPVEVKLEEDDNLDRSFVQNDQVMPDNVFSSNPRRSSRITATEIELTREEAVHQAIRTGSCELNLDVVVIVGKGRGVVAGKNFVRNELVCAHEGDLIDLKTAKARELEYRQDKRKGSYMYYFPFMNKSWCIDATKNSDYKGRLINHGRNEANLKTQTKIVDGIPKLVFFASKDIDVGTELLFDYGDKSAKATKDFPWLLK